jgi:hypothetical protein
MWQKLPEDDKHRGVTPGRDGVIVGVPRNAAVTKPSTLGKAFTVWIGLGVTGD